MMLRSVQWFEERGLLEKTPLKSESEEAVVLMTNALFLSTVQRAADIDALQTQLENSPDDVTILFQMCSHKMMQSKYREAMGILLRVIKLDYSWRDGIASLCMRGLFIMLGKDNALVIEFRQKLIDQQSH